MISTQEQNVVSQLDYADLDLVRFQEMLDEHGYVYLHGVPTGFDHVQYLSQIGPLMPQYDGELIWSIKAQERFDDLYHSLNTKPLMPHTECYEFLGLPPKYLALWCLVPAADGGGQTTLSDLYRFLETLTAEEREKLASTKFPFVSSAGVQDMGLGKTAVHPLLEEREGRSPVMRFSYNCVAHRDDPFLLNVRERVL
ncbi:MAG: TauD/TfdA family dioxygenase, partial [Pseudonocardiales bacterium]|nr:TauD/TfdA family dioxygenase [Pseudonocardiales bacterium]